MNGLAIANDYRVEQARLKRELKAGRLSLEDALVADCLKRVLLFDVLRRLPTGRRMRADDLAGDLFSAVKVGPLTRVGDLTARQRGVLVAAYRGIPRP